MMGPKSRSILVDLPEDESIRSVDSLDLDHRDRRKVEPILKPDLQQAVFHRHLEGLERGSGQGRNGRCMVLQDCIPFKENIETPFADFLEVSLREVKRDPIRPWRERGLPTLKEAIAARGDQNTSRSKG